MSDTTDTLPAGTAASAADQPGETMPLSRISARDLLHLTQGLYFVFWGLLISVVVAMQIVVTIWLRTFAEMFLGAGVVAILVGSWRLAQARLEHLNSPQLGALWRRRAHTILWLAVLLVYFCLLFYMWRRAVGNLYLQLNACAFVLTGIAYFVMLSRTVAVLAAGLGSSELSRESHLFNVINLILLVLPFIGTFVYVAVQSVLHGTNLLVEFNILLSDVNLVVALVFLLPLSLTLSMVWAAKDVALRRLAEIDERP